MKEKLIKKAQELRQHGFTTGEIADELNVSMDTARWLTLQKPTEEKPEAPVDFFINWKSLGGNSTRLRYVSGALSTNFGSVEGKKVVIVDDVITSGKTVKEVIHAVKDHGGEPIAVTVLIDKSGLSEIEEVPIESLIKVGRL